MRRFILLAVVSLLLILLTGCVGKPAVALPEASAAGEPAPAEPAPILELEPPIPKEPPDIFPSVIEQELEPPQTLGPLQYRKLDVFTTEAVEDVRHHATMRGYDLPDKIVEWPDFALYIVVQNLDDVSGTFEVRYTLSTGDKNAAEEQQYLVQRTPEEYAELDREYYEGSVELYLESGEVGIAICPPTGIYIDDRVPFSHAHEIIPPAKTMAVD